MVAKRYYLHGISSRRRETMTERVAEWKLCLSLIFPVFPLCLLCLQYCLCQSFASCFLSITGASRVWFPQLYLSPKCLVTPRSPLSGFSLWVNLSQFRSIPYESPVCMFSQSMLYFPRVTQRFPHSQSLLSSLDFFILLYPVTKGGGGVAGITVSVSLCPALSRGDIFWTAQANL